jgi:hypothetical protein
MLTLLEWFWARVPNNWRRESARKLWGDFESEHEVSDVRRFSCTSLDTICFERDSYFFPPRNYRFPLLNYGMFARTWVRNLNIWTFSPMISYCANLEACMATLAASKRFAFSFFTFSCQNSIGELIVVAFLDLVFSPHHSMRTTNTICRSNFRYSYRATW